ncbi:MAG: class II histone deacetylase [Paracoccaceae bacterium]|nr:class II histone deacetylase [Paracoccaceae bacterium]MDG2452452.1 class II histone deacetylase [Paracoccaceae bacterium]
MTTGFYTDERTFWAGGGNYAFTQPVAGLVQPFVGGGLPEAPETKRRFKNLMEVTGLIGDLSVRTAPEADRADLLRVHPATYLDTFKEMSDAGGGELGLRTPFGAGGYEICALSAGLAVDATRAVMSGDLRNAYSLSRPPGHHCLPEFPNGFCLMSNLAIAARAAQADHVGLRIAVIDWDVHHGNGTEAVFYDDADVLTISLHQEHNYPLDTGDFADRGAGNGVGTNLNIPLPSGGGHQLYLEAFDRLVEPAVRAHRPDLIMIACGFDAAAIDPLSRMLASADTFRQLTARTMALADDLCDGRIVMTHEGGYSEVYVPFCGHAVIEEMSGSSINAPDPYADTFRIRQPKSHFDDYARGLLDQMVAAL